MNPKILIIVPAYNAARHLPELVSKILISHPRNDLLIINDGSTDQTAEILRDLNCRSLSFSYNQGKGEALKQGFRVAVKENYDAVLTLDADLQHLPGQINSFLARYHTGDILIGTRIINPAVMPAGRILTNSMSSIIISIFNGRRIRDSQCGFRLVKKEVLSRLRLTSSKYDTESELLLQGGYLGFKAAEVPVDTIYKSTRSFINPLADTMRFIRLAWRRLWY
jgi:dolichol-phosphate mannosyltransferase